MTKCFCDKCKTEITDIKMVVVSARNFVSDNEEVESKHTACADTIIRFTPRAIDLCPACASKFISWVENPGTLIKTREEW